MCVIRAKSGCLFWNIESYNRRPAIKGFRTPTLTFSLPSPSLVLWVSIQTLVHARVAFSLGRCIIRITPIWSKLTKSLHPFSRQVMGDISGGRVGIAILFRPSIIRCPTTRFTRGRAKGFGKVSWLGFDRDVSFGEIFSCWQSAYVSLPSAAPLQLVSLKSAV